jgi:hypothetical protein
MTSRARNYVLAVQLFALLGTTFLAVAMVRYIRHAPQTYLESATVIFTERKSHPISNPNSTITGSLITITAVMVENLMSPHSAALIRKSGGTAQFDFTLANYYNQDFPEYSFPAATLTSESTDQAAAHNTFGSAVSLLSRLLEARQSGVPTGKRFTMHVVGDTGAVAQHGSLKRTYAAIGALALIAMSTEIGFISRRRAWLVTLLGRQ